MQTIENELKSKKKSSDEESEEKTHSLGLKQTSEVETHQGSNQLSKNLAMQLMNLIDSVNKDGVTPETVNASCNAASQIYKILRLNFEMKKEGF